MKDLRKASTSVRSLLRSVLSESLTDEFLRAATRALVGQGHSDVREPTMGGGQYAPPRTAKAVFAPEPIRPEDDDCTRHMAIFLICLLEAITGKNNRACDKSQYLPRLSFRVGVGVRELERYLIVFRSAGFLDTWQPRDPLKVNALPKRMRGKKYAYNIYQLNRELPHELAKRIAKQQHAGAAAERETLTTEPLEPLEPSLRVQGNKLDPARGDRFMDQIRKQGAAPPL